MIKLSPALVAGIKTAWKDPLYANAVYLIAGNIAAALFGFFFWAVAARFYTATEVGLASAAIAAMTMLGSFSHLGLGLGLVRFFPAADSRHRSRMMNSSLTLAAFTSAAIAVIFVLGINIWSPDLVLLQQNGTYFLLFVMFVAATAMTSISDFAFVARRRAAFTTIRSVTFNVLKLGLAAAFAGLFRSYGILNSWGIGLVLSLLAALFLLQPRLTRGYLPRPDFAWRETAEMIRFSVTNNISTILWSLPAWILPLLVLSRLGAAANAYFYIAWQIVAAISVVSQSVATSLFAEGSHQEKDFGGKAFNTLLLLLAIMVPVALVVVFFGGYILKLFGGIYAANATQLIRILILVQIPLAVNLVYFSSLRVRKKLKTLVILSLAVAVITLGVSFYLLPRLGLVAAGIGWVSGQTAVALWNGMRAGWGLPFLRRLFHSR